MTKNAPRFALILGVISVATALGVSGVYMLTHEKTLEKSRVTLENALKTLFPEAVAFEPVAAESDQSAGWSKDAGVGKAVGPTGPLGYIAVGGKQGYSSRIEVLVACDGDFKILGIQILQAAETPGLGERVKEIKSDATIWQAMARAVGFGKSDAPQTPREPWFQKQFAGKTLDQLIVVKEETDTNIQAITAATITSKAVTDAVQMAVEDIKKAAGAPESAAAEVR